MARFHRNLEIKAKSLQDAYDTGAFYGRMNRWELLDRVEKKNPDMKVFATATHRGLWINNRFICGIAHNITVPKYTIVCDNPGHWQDGRILARGWTQTFNEIKKMGYEVHDEDL